MSSLSLEHIMISFLLMSGGTVGGWALTSKMAGDEAALSFLLIGGATVLAISAAQFLLFQLESKRLIYRLLFGIAFGCGVVWFMLCLLLPVLWVESIAVAEKSLLFTFLVVLCIVNAFKGANQFKSKWNEIGEKIFPRYYKEKDSSLNWSKVVESMRFSMVLYMPGIPERMSPLISVILVVAMLTGLSFRTAFPIFSLYAWGVPSCIVISMFAQAIGLGIAQIVKVVALERKYGVPISPIA